MMRKETMRKVEELKAKVGNNVFNEMDCIGIISITTLRKYNLIENAVEVMKEEVSLDELINEVNNMIGGDCYGMEGEYINENGKIYYVSHIEGYKFRD